MSFVLLTDSCANLTEEIIRRYDIHVVSLRFREGDQEYSSFADGKPRDVSEFYQRMREGAEITTSRFSVEDAQQAVEAILRAGSDVLYIGFSSALSVRFTSSPSTCIFARSAVKASTKDWPYLSLSFFVCSSVRNSLPSSSFAKFWMPRIDMTHPATNLKSFFIILLIGFVVW